MLEEIIDDADERMGKTLESLQQAFARIRTGRASPNLLDGIKVKYYDVDTPLSQVASISVEDARTLVVSPWEKSIISVVQKEILKSDLGITPVTSGDIIRIPLPPLTEENRRDLAKLAKNEAENARIAIRNIRRDAMGDCRELVKEKMIAEDDGRRGEERIQGVTDSRIKQIDSSLSSKESDLMQI